MCLVKHSSLLSSEPSVPRFNSVKLYESLSFTWNSGNMTDTFCFFFTKVYIMALQLRKNKINTLKLTSPSHVKQHTPHWYDKALQAPSRSALPCEIVKFRIRSTLKEELLIYNSK